MKISLYIPSFNQKQYLIEAVESVLAQTLQPHQIIIIDDNSSDGSQQLIDGYKSRYPDLITPIYHTTNQGITRTRLHALKTVTGDYVTYVDGDDRLLKNKLEKEAKLLKESSNAQIAFSNYYYISPDGIRTGVWASTEVPPQGDVFRFAFARDFPKGSLFRNELVKLSCLKEIGAYDSSLLTHEDWDLKIRLTKRFKTVYCPDLLSEYRRNPNGLSKLPASLRLKSIEYVYDKNKYLLDDLTRSSRTDVKVKLALKFSQISQKAALDELEKGNSRLALHYWLKALKYDCMNFDFKLAARILFSVPTKL